MCSLAHTLLKKIEFKRFTGIDGGHENDYTLVKSHRIEKIGNHCPILYYQSETANVVSISTSLRILKGILIKKIRLPLPYMHELFLLTLDMFLCSKVLRQLMYKAMIFKLGVIEDKPSRVVISLTFHDWCSYCIPE